MKDIIKMVNCILLLCTMILSSLLVFGSSPYVARAEEQPLFSFTMTIPTGYEREYAAMLIVKESLAKNGIEMNVVREEGSTFWATKWGADTYRLTYAEGGYDAWSYWWYFRPEDLMFFSSYTPRGFPPEGWNEWTINNAVIDEALAAATSTYDMSARRQYYDRFTEEWQRDVPFMPLYEVQGCRAVRSNIENYVPIFLTANAFDWKVKGKTYDDDVNIKVAIPFTENYIDPIFGMTGSFSQSTTIAPVFPQLLKEHRRPDGTCEMVPDLAESYDVSSDGLTLTFHLHQNITWNDGVPFTAEDVKVTYEGMLDPTTGVPALADLKSIASIETPDKYTVVFHMDKVNTLILTALGGFTAAGIVPAHVFGKVPHAQWRGYWMKPEQVVSLGAYKIVEFLPNERTVLEADSNYWRGRPFVDRIEVFIVPEVTTALSALMKGEMDIVGIEYGLSGPETMAVLPDLEKDPNIDATFESNSGVAYLGLNLNHPILNNRYVRLAIANLIPIDTIIADVLKGHGKAASGPIESGSPFYNPDFPPICQYNPEKAKEYLAKAGYAPKATGVPMTFYAYPVIALIVGLAIGTGAIYVTRKRAAK